MSNPADGFGGRGLSRELPDPYEYLRQKALEEQQRQATPPAALPQENPQMTVEAEPLMPPPPAARPVKAATREAVPVRERSQRELLREELSSRRALQRAFLLIEVLGPPKALRDPDRR